MEADLSDAFLDRVRCAYKRAIAATSRTRGMWAALDERRADVHHALVADENRALRAIFADPTTTDLYYGLDDLCRSLNKLADPSNFISAALQHDRARIAAYQIARLQELMPVAKSVIEIGPGMGRAAYYGHRAGLDYTTIDLPLGIAAQACFLGRALGPDALWFAGEEHLSSEGRIKLLYSVPDRRFDLALNVDSITEMPGTVAFDYFRWAAAHVSCLISINHGNNLFTVAQLSAFSAPNELLVRRPCPAWDGYTDEAYGLSGLGTLPRGLRLNAFKTLLFAQRIRRGIARRHQSLKAARAPHLKPSP